MQHIMYYSVCNYYVPCRIILLRTMQGSGNSRATGADFNGHIHIPNWEGDRLAGRYSFGDGLAGPRTKVPEIWRFDAMQ
jgi:hypothetical protein